MLTIDSPRLHPTDQADTIDHADCPPDAHRAAAGDGEPATADGRILCQHCHGTLLHCWVAADANRTEPGYQRVYVHTDPTRQETC